MTARRFSRCLTVVAVAMLALASAGSAAPLHVSFGSDGRYPARALLASAPASHPLDASTVHVTENGGAVSAKSVTPISTANAGDFGVMLMIDTSPSMAGEPIKQAMIAARALAAQRTGQQELGVVEFNRSASVVLPLTSNPTTIRSALARTPNIGAGTHVYDAALLALRQLHDSNVAAATLIVLSDGADRGSQATLQAVAAAAAADHIHIYTVGVKDRYFSPQTLIALARHTSGSYTASDASGLGQVFMNIESQLTNRYVVRYRSRQALGHRIQVQLTVDGIPGTWTAAYSSPAPPPPLSQSHLPPPVAHAAKSSFWSSTLALLLVVFGGAALLVLGLLVHFVPQTREHALRLRIGEFTAAQEAETTVAPSTTSRLTRRLDAWLGGFPRGLRFKEEVDVAAIQASPAEVLMLTAISTLIAAALLSALLGTVLISLPILLIGPAVMSVIVRQRADKQRRLFVDALAGHLEEVGGAMRAGHSVVAAISSMAEDATDPTRREFQRAVADEQLGVPIEAALQPIARRMRCSDIEQLSLVAALNQRTGGNMAEVLDLIAAGVRERAELRRELDALTAAARLSRWIVTGLPPGVLLVFIVIRPAYVRPLFHTAGGTVALCIAAGLVVVGSLVMRMILATGE